MKSGKWKSQLISSSLPLEFEVAKLLVAKGFSTTSDFSYSRSDANAVKDFSVDLRATYFTRSQRRSPMCELKLLVECKQRHSSNWLFLPDPNTDDFLPTSWGHTVRVIDQFSPWFCDSAHSALDGGAIPVCYKATEITERDRSYDAEIRHGLFQLQWAVPRLIVESIRESAHSKHDDRSPFFFTAVLVTNANLFVAHRNISTRKIEQATSVRDLGKPVPMLVYYLDPGPEFDRHCKLECDSVEHLSKRFADTEKERIRNSDYITDLPSSVISTLMRNGDTVPSPFSHFLICNIAALPHLINELKKIANRHATNLRPQRRRHRNRRRLSA